MHDAIVAGLGAMGSAAANREILAGLVTGGETCHPIDRFSPARLAGKRPG